jgi:hypothetical protein
MNGLNRGWWGRCAVACVAAAGVVAPAANAQMMGDMSGMGMMAVSKRQMDGYARALGLEPAQKEAALALLDAYRAEYTKAMKDFQEQQRAAMRQAQEEMDFSAATKVMVAEGMKFQQRQQAAEKQFFDDVQALCTPDQAARWDRVERMRRREQFMRVGMVSGAGVDLVALIDRAGVAPADAAEFAPVLERYEFDIDRKLSDLKRAQDDMQAEQAKMAEGGFDMARMQEMMANVEKMLKPLVDVAKDIRETNRDYVRRLGAFMSDEARAKFEAEFNRRAFPRVYRPAHVESMLEAAAKFPDLSAEQRDQVRAISQEYARAAAPLNDRWAQAVQAQEDQSGGTFGVMSKMWTGGGEGADAVKDARKARTDLDAQTADRLRALLTPEQVERLPERKSDEWNPMADFLSPEDAEAMKELQEAAGGGK